MRRAPWWLLLLAVGLLVPVLGLGQHTGGSFGHSNWGSGASRPSSSSSGGWRPSSSSGSGGWSSSGGGYHSSGGYGTYGGGGGGSMGGGEACCVLTFFALVIVVGLVLQRKNTSGATLMPVGSSVGPMYGDPNNVFSLGAVAIAFDAQVRAQVQSELDRIAQSSGAGPGALERSAAMVAQVLARFTDHAYLAHHALSEGVDMNTAQARFQQAVEAERGRFMIETVRGDAGGVRRVDGPRSRARAEEGGGFVVVTVLACRRGRFPGFQAPTSRQALTQDLQILLAGAGALQALEVVWVPSDPNDVMSSAEMATVFPTLGPLAPDARVGRRACGSCKAVFAAELGRCPNCGAP